MISKLLFRFALGPSFLESVDDDNPVKLADKANREKLENIAKAQTTILEYIVGNTLDNVEGNYKDEGINFRNRRRRSSIESVNGIGNTSNSGVNSILHNSENLHQNPLDDQQPNNNRIETLLSITSQSRLPPPPPDPPMFIPLNALLLRPSALSNIFDTKTYRITSITENSSFWIIRNILNPTSLTFLYRQLYGVLCWPLSAIRSLTATYNISFKDAFHFVYIDPWALYRQPYETYLLLCGFEVIKMVGGLITIGVNDVVYPRLFDRDLIDKGKYTTFSYLLGRVSPEEGLSTDFLLQIDTPNGTEAELSKVKRTLFAYKITKFIVSDVLLEAIYTILAHPLYHRYITNILFLTSSPSISEMYKPSFYTDSQNIYLICALLSCRVIEMLSGAFLSFILSKYTNDEKWSKRWEDIFKDSLDDRLIEPAFVAKQRADACTKLTTRLISSFIGEILCHPFSVYVLRLFAKTYHSKLPIAKGFFPSSLGYAIAFEWSVNWIVSESYRLLLKLAPLITLTNL